MQSSGSRTVEDVSPYILYFADFDKINNTIVFIQYPYQREPSLDF